MSKPKLKSKTQAESALRPARNAGKAIVDSAQHIWLAGLGAFAKAQEEGTKLFEALVREGIAMDQKTRKLAAGKADEVRSVVESRVGQVRERSQETWDKLEKVFENRVSRALGHLGVPGSHEIKALTARVEELAREVHKLNAAPGTKAPARAAAKPAVKPAARRAAARVKDELAEVARELESAQLAAKPSAKKAVAKKKPAKKA